MRIIPSPRHDLEALARLGPAAYAQRLKQQRRRQRRDKASKAQKQAVSARDRTA